MKYSLVTGGSRGLGRAVCLKLAQMGIPVIINYQSNEKAAEEVRDLIIAQGGQAILMKFNVADKDEVSAALEAWEKEHPDDYIAYLVNNAGIRRDNVMFMMPDEDWHSVIDVTLNGFFYVTRHLLPKMMMRRHGGRIVNMASLSGLKGMAGQTNYSAAKAALIGATKALAQEVAKKRITVNAVAPGFIQTPFNELLWGNPEKNAWISERTLAKRFGMPEDLTGTVQFLSSAASDFMTGQVLLVDGGFLTGADTLFG